MHRKPRHKHHSNSRAIRRALLEIAPENSHPQTQSPLFAILPSEVRNQIFEYVVCQTFDYSCPVSRTSHLHRPGHEYRSHTDTALLRTCRLVYYETRSIPLQSATHHLYEAPNESFNPFNWDHYLFHISSQSGKNLHHLHTTKWRAPFTFDTYLKAHLCWRKLTWTLCASEWTPADMVEAGHRFNVCDALAQQSLPNSCHEVNLEFESLKEFPRHRKLLRGFADRCRGIELTKCDGSRISIDDDHCMEYSWEGTTWKPRRAGYHWEGDYVTATYYVIRLCWREKVPEREYMHYDRLDCLRSSRIVPLSQEDIANDVESK